MQVSKELIIPVSVPLDSVWQIVQEVETLIPCMPGAAIIETLDGGHYKATIRVRIGPITANFKGDIHLKDSNADAHTMVVEGQGGDVKGTSTASMVLEVAIVSQDATSSEIRANSVVTVTGKLASFGGRMMNDVTDRLLAQFSQNITELIVSHSSGTEYSQPAREMNALAMVFGVVWDWIKGIFSSTKTSAT